MRRIFLDIGWIRFDQLPWKIYVSEDYVHLLVNLEVALYQQWQHHLAVAGRDRAGNWITGP